MLTQLSFRGRVLLVFAPFAVTGVNALWGQAVNGTISGTVTDPSGAAIAGATVERTPRGHRIARLPSVDIGSDRTSGRDFFGVA